MGSVSIINPLRNYRKLGVGVHDDELAVGMFAGKTGSFVKRFFLALVKD
jgi:hypothetical protein